MLHRNVFLLFSATAVSAQRLMFVNNCANFPEACNNDCYAIYTAGRPADLTYIYDHDNSATNRMNSVGKAPCCGANPRIPTAPGTMGPIQTDEYPFACAEEGGAGAPLRCINGGQNARQGGALSGFFSTNGCYNTGVQCDFTMVFSNAGNSPYCSGAMGGANDGFEWLYTRANNAYNPAKRDNEEDVGTWKLHKPNPNDYIPPSERRELLLSNGERILLGTNSTSTSFDGQEVQIFTGGESFVTAKVVRELFGDEKSPYLR